MSAQRRGTSQIPSGLTHGKRRETDEEEVPPEDRRRVRSGESRATAAPGVLERRSLIAAFVVSRDPGHDLLWVASSDVGHELDRCPPSQDGRHPGRVRDDDITVLALRPLEPARPSHPSTIAGERVTAGTCTCGESVCWTKWAPLTRGGRETSVLYFTPPFCRVDPDTLTSVPLERDRTRRSRPPLTRDGHAMETAPRWNPLPNQMAAPQGGLTWCFPGRDGGI
jgi:hypothetical protein